MKMEPDLVVSNAVGDSQSMGRTSSCGGDESCDFLEIPQSLDILYVAKSTFPGKGGTNGCLFVTQS